MSTEPDRDRTLLPASGVPADATFDPYATREAEPVFDESRPGSTPIPLGATALPDPTGLFQTRVDAELFDRDHRRSSAPGDLVAGRYRVGPPIGEGGMGSVYAADQVEPVRRRVAIKLIKAGMDSARVLARFESERQALAMMDHPHIAKVLDAGATPEGRPFFVMELVQGVPLNEYCEAHRLNLASRLELIRQVCSAVQHAHQKGIIHRDLKPSNILVESHDGRPVPKVIDFGLAKATNGTQLSDFGMATVMGSMAGTPLYMAPEQANFDTSDIDTRADLYALGVILYEVVSGSTPIERDTISRTGWDEMLRVIREVDPPPPSRRIAATGGPAGLGGAVRGELDWIIMKALAKERDRRYDSATALADDLGRFLRHEPVAAGPPSATYRVRKFVRRHRIQAAAVATVAIVLVAGVIGTTWGLVEARRQERRAQAGLDQVEGLNQVLGTVFKDLDPGQAEKDGRPLAELLGENLDRAAEKLSTGTIGEPIRVARMQQVLGHSQAGLGHPQKAIDLLTRAYATLARRLGDDDTETIRALAELADAVRNAGELDRARGMFRRVADATRAKLGDDAVETITATNNLAASAMDLGDLATATAFYEQNLARTKKKPGDDRPETLDTLNGLGLAYLAAGRVDEATKLLERALAGRIALSGEDHPATFMSMENLGNAHFRAGRYAETAATLEKVLAGRKAKLGMEHRGTLATMLNLAVIYQKLDRLDRATSLAEQAVEGLKSTLGADHPDTLQATGQLGSCFLTAGKLDRAIAILEDVHRRQSAKLIEDHPSTEATRDMLATAYQRAERFDLAIPLEQQRLARVTSRHGADDPRTFASLNSLALAYQFAGRLDEALPLFERALAGQRVKPGVDRPETQSTMMNLALALQAAGQPDRALPLFLDFAEIKRRRAQVEPPSYAAALASLGPCLLDLRRWSEAEATCREALAIQEQANPEGWRTFSTRSMLGAALLGQGRVEEAGPFIRSGYEGMNQRQAKIIPQARLRLVQALDRVIDLDHATGHADDIAPLLAERDRIVVSPASAKKPYVKK